MDALVIYFIKANGLIVCFYLLYHFLLRQETFFEKNRYFLLFGLFGSLLLPFLTITKTVWVEPIPQATEMVIDTNNTIQNTSISATEKVAKINLQEVLFTIYGVFALLFVLKIGVELLSFFKFIRKGNHTKNNGCIFINHPKNTNPFSFFNYIVYNEKNFSTDELQHIIAHEKIHVNQNHSADVLVAKLFCAFFWINPIVWLYRKELLQNLEYIADDFAALQTSTILNYQKTLLKVVTNQHQLTITNQFYQSLIKKRIVMLNTQKSNPKKSWKYSILIPVLVCFVLVFQVETIAQIKEMNPNQENLKKSDTTKIARIKQEQFTSIYNSPFEGNPEEKRLIVINGKPYSKTELEQKGIAKLKGKGTIIKLTPAEGLAKYGEKGKFGAIEFNGDWKIVAFEIADTTEDTTAETASYQEQNSVDTEESGTTILTSVLTKNTTDKEIKELEKKFYSKKHRLTISNIKRNEKAEITTIKLSFDTNKTYNRVTEIISESPITDIEIYVKTDANEEIAVGFVQKQVATSSSESRKKTDHKKLTYSSGGENFTEDKLWIINGNAMYPSEFLKGSTLSTNGLIRELSIQESIAKYGEKGKNGVVIVEGTTKFIPKIKSNQNENDVLVFTNDTGDDIVISDNYNYLKVPGNPTVQLTDYSPTLIVNGVKQNNPKGTMQIIDLSKIKSIRIFDKNDKQTAGTAIEKIIITTK